MKKLKISINSAAIPAGYSYTHIATSYQVSTGYDFTSDELVFQSLEDRSNLTDIIAIVDDNYNQLWIRTKYHYQSPTGNVDSYWSIPQEINDDVNKTDFYNNSVISYTPIVKFNRDDLGNLNITTSEFNLLSGSGEHISTSWVIKDSDEIPVYVRENDSNNLTSITPTLELTDNNVYIVEVNHNTNPNASSYSGKDIIFPTKPNGSTFDFELVSGFSAVSRCWHNISLNVTNFSSYDIEIRDLSGNLITSSYDSIYLTDYLNTNICKANVPYVYNIRLNFTDGTSTNWVEYGPYVDSIGGDDTHTYCQFFVEGPDTDIQEMTNINSYGINVNGDEYFYYIKNNKVARYLFTIDNITCGGDCLDLSGYDIAPIPEATFIDMGNSEVLISIRLKDNSTLFLLCLMINPITLELKIVDEYIFKDSINLLGVANKWVKINSKVYFPFEVGSSSVYRKGLHLVSITTLNNKLDIEYLTISSSGKWVNPVVVSYNNNFYVINGGTKVTTATNDVNYTKADLNIYVGNILAGSRWLTDSKDDIECLTLLGGMNSSFLNTISDLIGYSSSSGFMVLNNTHTGSGKLKPIIANYNVTTNLSDYIELPTIQFHKVPFRNNIKLINGDILRISSDIRGNGLRNQVSYIMPITTSIYASRPQIVSNPLEYTTTLTNSDYTNNIKILKPYHLSSDTGYIRPTKDTNLVWRDEREVLELDHTEVISTSNLGKDLDIKNMRGLNITANCNCKLSPGMGLGDHNSKIASIK